MPGISLWEEQRMQPINRRLAAEFFGTFWLVFGGCGAAIFAGSEIGFQGIAFAFGLTVLTMCYAVGHISGGHFNPAVSCAAALTGRMSWLDAGIYAAVQFVAALATGLTLLIATKLYGLDHVMARVSTTWDHGGGTDFLGGFLLELIGTATFVFVIL